MTDEKPERIDVTAATVMEIHGLSPEEMIAAATCYQGYMAIARVLLETPPPPPAIHFLRALGRIGLETPPGSDWGRTMQRDVLKTLERLGIEPFSREELRADVADQAQRVAARLVAEQEARPN